MGAEPEFEDGVRRGVVQGEFAELLEGLAADLLRVGDDAVNGLLAVDIGVVLDGPAEGVGKRPESVDSTESTRRRTTSAPQSCCEGMRHEAPYRASRKRTPWNPSKSSGSSAIQSSATPANHMAQSVVAHLVGEDEADLAGRAAGDGGVPDDDALGRSEAGDVGVELSGLDAGLHQEHALGRDGDSSAYYDLLQSIDQRRVGNLRAVQTC